VVYAGAGIRLRKNATVSALQAAVSRVTEDPRYRAAAQQMAARLASERDDNRAVAELEQVGARGPADG
jgi:UDP:flavonoid glycosyltransferase YjiC (YdhE family)